MVFILLSFVIVSPLAFQTNIDVDNFSTLREDRFREQVRPCFWLHHFSIFFLFFSFVSGHQLTLKLAILSLLLIHLRILSLALDF